MKLHLKDELLQHSMVLFASMMLANVTNLGYQMVVSRMLPKPEYTLLITFLGILLIVSRPMSMLSTGMSHYVSMLEKQDRRGDIKRLLRKWMLLTGIPSIILAIPFALLAGHIAETFHLERKAPVVVMALSLPALFVFPVINGTAQGLQYFGWAALMSMLRGLLRVGICAAVLVLIYAASGWALVGHSGSLYIVTVILLLVLIRKLHGHPSSDMPLPSMRLYLAQSLVIQASYAVLMTADVVLVNHFFIDETDFSYAATLGRQVATIAMAIGMALFPKVVSQKTETIEHRQLFARSIIYALICTIPALMVCVLFPRMLLHLILGVADASDSMVLYTRMMALVMAFASILNIVVQYAVAQRRFITMVPVVLFACMYLAFAAWLHSSVMHVVGIALLCNMLALGTSLFILLRSKR